MVPDVSKRPSGQDPNPQLHHCENLKYRQLHTGEKGSAPVVLVITVKTESVTRSAKLTLHICDTYVRGFIATHVSNLSYGRFIPLKTKHRLPYLKTQSVPRCKHFSFRL
jgi:hypothetical protein